ncbi:malignant fibrous histiocytoma-amplified sequence 1 homolog isoform X2 [Nematostella vectensis]|uniref:malignant fibrous histiocytoma-amplified sequence 1 homolog isoform X2 n=1 Tax=Nematostella vectensis TaxID=45351 RepID=UPI002076FB5F|nr:malignant fibrous histiocytoma-amplified sequence 1 homolog isoform X2 [Nematostella vectensis]
MEEEFMMVNIAPKEVTPMVINGQVTADYSRYDIVSTFPNFMSVNNLQVIRMPTTDLEYIPEEFCNMKCLKELSLFGDGIRQSGLTFLPEKFANLKSLQVLNLEQNQFENFPLQICELINLEKLYLNACGLTLVPQSIINLVHLSDIDLSSNDLSLNGLPNEFFQLPKLKQLYLNDCQLKTLPSDIGLLRTLEGLQLNDNFLKTFPDELYSLRHLKKISAKNNCLICLSSRIIELQSLEKLLLMENNITVLPAEIAKLPNLQFVNVFDNKLTRLPESLTDLGSTTRIVVRGNNHLQMPPLDVCNKGMNSIRGFFESMKKSRPVHSKRMKLVLLGESGAGKTSCAHGLVECEAINQTLNDSTVGVVIRNWQVEPDGLEVQVVDCAGQRRYQLTHPFFLSEGALHLLVINLHSYKKTPESFERNAGDWIKWVTSRLEKPRIMVVLTHRDECREDEITDKCSDILKGIKSLESHEVRRLKMEMEAIKKKGKDKDVDRKVEQLKWQIKNRPIISSVLLHKSEICYKEISDNKSGWLGMVAVSNMHELEGMMQLRQEIIRASKDMSLFPSVGRDLPESWVKLELAIKEFRSSVKAPNVPCMTVGQFNKFALDKSGLSGIGLLSALHYFESVGELKYYSGMPPAEFCVFLDLPWLGKLVKLLFRHDYEENLMFSDSYFKFDMEKIMFDHSVTKLKRDGVLSLQLLRCIWNEMSFDNDTFNQMVNAFLHFGLACRLPSPVDDEPCLFIPWFLHSGSRPQDWKDCPDDDEVGY